MNSKAMIWSTAVVIAMVAVLTIMCELSSSVKGFFSLFGNAWMDSIGMTEEKAKEANMGIVMGISLVMAFLISFFLLNFCNGVGQEGEFDSFKHGAAHGLILGGFLVGPIFITNGLFEQKSWKNMLINALYWLITLALMGGILDSMNHMG